MEIFLNFINELFKDLKRPSTANIIYFICGIIELIIVISLISPFYIRCEFLDQVKMRTNICDSDLFVRIALIGIIAYTLVVIIRKILIQIFSQKSESKLYKRYALLYTIDNILDTFSAIFCLLFICAVFIQFYKTQVIFLSHSAWMIYIVVSIRFITLISARTFANNLEIINKAVGNK